MSFFGYGKGSGRGRRRGGQGRHGSEGRGLGPEGYCICLRCGYRAPKQPGVPCKEMRCPRCGAALIREGGYHHQLFLDKVQATKNNQQDKA